MKKILILLFLSLFIFSCDKSDFSLDKIISNFKQEKIENEVETNTWKALNEVVESKEENNTWSLEEENKYNKLDLKSKIDTLNKKTEEKTINPYCIFDEYCIPSDFEVKEDKDYFFAKKTDGDSLSESYKLSKQKDFFEYKKSKSMNNYEQKVFKVWDNYIVNKKEFSCWWSKIEQKVFDNTGKELVDFLLPEYKKNIKVWNISYKPTIILKGSFWPLDGENEDFLKFYRWEENKLKIYENEKELEDFINEKVFNEDKRLYWYYLASYSKYPWITVVYESVWYDASSIRVVWLWTDKDYLSKNIWENGDYYDLAITNKIIWYYSLDLNLGIFDNDWNRVLSITEDKIPFFNMKKLNEKGNYLVYLKPWYKTEKFAEMCKPVVYYYSDQKEENKLTLNLKKWDYFTKLIPDLDNNNSWNFLSNNWKIVVEDKEYDYLYYSLVSLGYNHNNDWWVVKWENIKSFFNDKLDKINFNANEKRDFINFWQEEYEKEKYYFVSFKYKEELDKIVKLDFLNEVKGEFRVLLDSYEIQDYSEERYKDYLYENVWNNFDNFLIKSFDRWSWSNEVFEWWWVLRKKEETIIK